MKKLVFVALIFLAGCAARPPADGDIARWERRARNVTITRDDWGIAHVSAGTDADAVFGMVYVQAEDDFNRVETNYLNAMGRLAEAEGEAAIFRDLRMRLFIDAADMKARYDASTDWLKALMIGFADGLNFYLRSHPSVTPRVIMRFEPWMALTFTEGSIGGDIERISVSQLGAFYGKRPAVAGDDAADADADAAGLREPGGSNGLAIAPGNTASGHALLLINPHTSFFFRSELQVTSAEGLNAYGAVTWGQFFVYQGWNDTAGWMHTSSNADNIDEYLETVTRKGDGYTYRYGAEERPVIATRVTVPFKTGAGMADKTFTVYRTHHGPVVREVGGRWVSVRLMQDPVKALMQSFLRTKAKNYREFARTMELHTNSSNNTVFTDAEGNIAYFHANFIPRRDPRFDWDRPVDGSNPATEWGDVLSVADSPNVLNPPNGWIQNTNNWPWSAAGPNSAKRSDYPRYVDTGTETPRGLHAMAVLQGKDGRKDFTLESLIAAAFDSRLPAFDILIPGLLQAYDRAKPVNPLKARLAEQIEALRTWDRRWSPGSVATSLAVFWGDALWRRTNTPEDPEDLSIYQGLATRTPDAVRLEALAAASDKLTADFGTWKTPWGEINCLQRLTGDIVHPFDDARPSIPVGFTSGRWGSLAAFEAQSYKGSRKLYGTSGNSFVAAVEFGDSVRARAVTVGGASGHPSSPHFNDQSARYSTGDLRDVYFTPAQLAGHIERVYHPGD